jgi:hypothetical protein
LRSGFHMAALRFKLLAYTIPKWPLATVSLTSVLGPFLLGRADWIIGGLVLALVLVLFSAYGEELRDASRGVSVDGDKEPCSHV